MDAQKVDNFITTNAKYFPSEKLSNVKSILEKVEDSNWISVQGISFKDPTIMLIVSIIGGSFGIDRFMLGDTGLGVGKLLTCGGLGIWAIIDWFIIMNRAKDVNYQKLQENIA